MSNNTIHPTNQIQSEFDGLNMMVQDVEYCPSCQRFRQADQSVPDHHTCLTCHAETLFVESLYQQNLQPAWANHLITQVKSPTSPTAPAAPAPRNTKYTYSEGMTDREKKALRKAARKAAQKGRLPEKDYL